MGDGVFVLVSLAFFALCWLYVRGCDGLVRSGEEAPEQAEVTQ
ncbi:MAG: potassium transporter Trk [Acidimicrobiia bacterium]